MKKIPTLFVRDYETIVSTGGWHPDITLPAGDKSFTGGHTESKKGRFLAINQITPGCEWVINGEGIATRKWDGICCKIENGILYKRYDAKQGKTPPDGFIPAQEPDPVTGHWPGWIKIGSKEWEDPANKWIVEAYENTAIDPSASLVDGTYEAVGPKINGNKDNLPGHRLILHGYQTCEDCPRDFEGIRGYLDSEPIIEGIVFHHPDSRMCKIKRSDFGLKW